MNKISKYKPFTKRWGYKLDPLNVKLPHETTGAVRQIAKELGISQARFINGEILKNKRAREIAQQLKQEKRDETKESTTTS